MRLTNGLVEPRERLPSGVLPWAWLDHAHADLDLARARALPVLAAGLQVAGVVVGELARPAAGAHALLRALVQPLAAPLHGGEELVEVDLERREDPVRPVLHLEPRLACLAARVVHDLLRLALGELDDLGLRCLAHGL